MNTTQTSLVENLRAMPRGAWILFFGCFLNKFGTFVLPFLAIYVTRLGYTTAQAGIPIAAYGVGTLAASLLGGHLSDRIGRRKTIVLSMFSAAGAMLWLSQARTLPELVVLSGLAGVTGELYRPASSALLADLVRVRVLDRTSEPERRPDARYRERPVCRAPVLTRRFSGTPGHHDAKLTA